MGICSMNIGYARVSTIDQNLELQLDALQNAKCEQMFQEKITGTKLDRPALMEALAYARTGDVLVIWKLDRLGRSLKELLNIVNELEQRKIGLKSLQENIDTTTSTGKLVLPLLSGCLSFDDII